MLGRGLESLIPAGGYKKPEDQGLPQTNPGQASSAYSEVNPSQAGFGQDSQALPPHSENQPVPAAQPSYPGGYRPFHPLAEADLSPQPASHQDGGFADLSTAKTEPMPQYIPPHTAEPQPVFEPRPAYGQPAVSPIQGFAGTSQPFAIQESEMKPALMPSYSAPAGGNAPQPGYGHAEEGLGESELDYSRGQASVFQIEVERIFPNPQQPRRHFDEDALNELASSIREFGIIQPLVVTKMLKETESGTEVTYQLIAGERRLMAAKKVGLRTVPAVIKRVGMDRERLELAIIENIQRENLNPLEAARSYARLQDEFGLTQREIAIRMGKSRETIANTLRLLNLPSEIQQALEDGRINESHARLLLQIDDIARQKDMFQSILRSKPSVRELKATIRREKTGPSGNYLNPELMSLQSRLEEFLGTKAQIDDNGGKGRITINYYSPEELSALISRLSGEDF